MMHAPLPRRDSAVGKVLRAMRAGPMPWHQCIAIAACLAVLPVIFLIIAEVAS